jgi:GDP-D-mannose 3',5'-epimerase
MTERHFVTGAGGMIGGHLAAALAAEGHEVVAADIKPLDDWHQISDGVGNHPGVDLSGYHAARELAEGSSHVWLLAADMGGMGFIESHKLACMQTVDTTSTILKAAAAAEAGRLFYASSACVYPAWAQRDADVVLPLAEDMAYPADPEDGYGWEKLFGERMARHYREDAGLETRVARFHNIYGTHTEWQEPRSKAPAAIARKVATAELTGVHEIQVWGDGKQARSFCHTSDCVEGMRRLMASDYVSPLNIGSAELVTVDDLVDICEELAGIRLARHYNPAAPQGVRGRNSDNTRCREVLGWEPSTSLRDGMAELYGWVREQLRESLLSDVDARR